MKCPGGSHRSQFNGTSAADEKSRPVEPRERKDEVLPRAIRENGKCGFSCFFYLPVLKPMCSSYWRSLIVFLLHSRRWHPILIKGPLSWQPGLICSLPGMVLLRPAACWPPVAHSACWVGGRWCNGVVLNWEWLGPTVDTWQHLETFLVVATGGGCHWHVVGRGQGCCQTSYEALGSPPAKSHLGRCANSAELRGQWGSGSATRWGLLRGPNSPSSSEAER